MKMLLNITGEWHSGALDRDPQCQTGPQEGCEARHAYPEGGRSLSALSLEARAAIFRLEDRQVGDNNRYHSKMQPVVQELRPSRRSGSKRRVHLGRASR